MLQTLLLTKIQIPPRRRQVVARSQLIAQLNQGLMLQRKLTLISAPAGFGKSNLVVEWGAALRSKPRSWQMAWLGLDEADSSLPRFFEYVVGALQQIDSLDSVGEQALALLRASRPPPAEVILTALINELAALPCQIVLVLDDYHLLDSAEIDAALAFLLDHLPPQLHLAIVTRIDPQFPTARLRASGDLTELRAADLRFSREECEEYFNRIMGLQLSVENLKALTARTEGWVAGLQLAAISLQARSDPDKLIENFGGSQQYVMDFLMSEVLERQPVAVQEFLLRTAILERLSGPACRAVTGRADSQTQLEQLVAANLFLQPLDEQRNLFRYHHLFGQLLQQQLKLQRPDEVAPLHAKASRWYVAQGDVVAGIEHGLQAGEHARAAQLLLERVTEIREQGAYSKVRRWLDTLPPDLIRNSPQLALLRAEGLLAIGQQAEAAELLEVAEAGLNGRSPQAQTTSLRGKIAVTQAFLAFFQGDVPTILDRAQRALELLPEEDVSWRSGAVNALGDAHMLQGNMAAAEKVETEALYLSRSAGDIYMTLVAGAKLAISRYERGKLREAMALIHDLQGLAQTQGLERAAISGWCRTIGAVVLAEQNRLEQSLIEAQAGLTLMKSRGRFVDVGMLGWGYYCLLQILFSRQAYAEMVALLDEVAAFTRDADVPPWIEGRWEEWQVRLWLAQGDLAAVSRWAAQRPFDASRAIPYPQAREARLVARIRLAQGRPAEALNLIQRLLPAAVEGGRTRSAIQYLILQALALQAGGTQNAALKPLTTALSRAEPSGFVRLFVDEGEPIARLLRAAQADQTLAGSPYVARLLQAFDTAEEGVDEAQPAADELLDPLSERELEILGSIAAGLTNRQIADHYYLTLNTVKVHTRNIYSKLDVHTRTQAVARGRELGLL